MGLRTAKNFGNIVKTDSTDGLWIAFFGDSLLRGVFVEAVSFLTATSLSGRIIVNYTHATKNKGHYMCCTLRHSDTAGSEIDRCELHMRSFDKVADEVLARRAPGAIPLCVSFDFNVYANSLPHGFRQLAATFARTGVHPGAVVINPGIWMLGVDFNLDQIMSR